MYWDIEKCLLAQSIGNQILNYVDKIDFNSNNMVGGFAVAMIKNIQTVLKDSSLNDAVKIAEIKRIFIANGIDLK